MRKKVLLFICVTLLVLVIVPVINLTLENAPKKPEEKWWSSSVLYNFDFALPLLIRCLYPFGISISPSKVVIGKHDWLFLGDAYSKSITVGRKGVNQSIEYDAIDAKNIGLATKSWEQWLKDRGILYRIMIVPQKNKVYPEFLPDWAQPAVKSEVDTILSNVNQGLYFDSRPVLMTAKSQFSKPLYYKTDTHWNSLGAWVTFRAFIKNIARTETGLRQLSDQQVQIIDAKQFQFGNLADFLRLMGILQDDSDVIINIDSEHPIETEQYDLETGNLTQSGGNPKIGYPIKPFTVKSKYALNKKKVLWLRDSFGTAMSPFMAATFTETLQAYCETTTPDQFVQLVTDFKPDYVFITVVDGAAYAPFFFKFPPK